MVALTCYKIRRSVGGQAVADFDDVVDGDRSLTVYGPQSWSDFQAKLYVSDVPPHPPRWGEFLHPVVGSDLVLPATASVAALLVVRIGSARSPEFYAFAFGPGGRFLLRSDSYERAYGLRAALNVIYPVTQGDSDLSRLTSLDAKRRAEGVLRSRRQLSRAATFETFDLDRLRDILSAATGRPEDTAAWGNRVSGGDALSFSTESPIRQLGAICRAISEVHDRTDYQARFAFLDRIRPISDEEEVGRLEALVVEALKAGEVDQLDLAPPEIIDWSVVDGFRFHLDRDFTRPEMRLQDYLRTLGDERLAALDVGYLRSHHALATSAGELSARWPLWRCLTGELEIDGATYVLDEGDFFAIDRDYVQQVDAEVRAIATANLELPTAARTDWEDAYNIAATNHAPGRLLLDRKTVITPDSTTPIEVCDILTTGKQLVHVKRHLGSSDLSHLFSQGFVSADLLQMSPQFRQVVKEKIEELDSSGAFGFIDGSPIIPSEYEVVYVIVAAWRGRTLAEGLPFFSKVNLVRTVTDLAGRGFNVGHVCVDAT
jgi:uncharacterized protein (TIGR04141 family)